MLIRREPRGLPNHMHKPKCGRTNAQTSWARPGRLGRLPAFLELFVKFQQPRFPDSLWPRIQISFRRNLMNSTHQMMSYQTAFLSKGGNSHNEQRKVPNAFGRIQDTCPTILFATFDTWLHLEEHNSNTHTSAASKKNPEWNCIISPEISKQLTFKVRALQQQKPCVQKQMLMP